MREVGVDQMIGNVGVITEGTIKVLVTVDQGHVLEQVPIQIKLDVSSVESTIILWDCPTTQADREVEQIQQMFNMDEEQTLLQMPLIDKNHVRQCMYYRN